MPELPEVETFRRRLLQGRDCSPSILGKKITGAVLLWEGILAEPAPDEFLRRIPGQYVTGVGRRGKHLLVHLSRDILVFHLRMSGELIVEDQREPEGSHYRLMVNFGDGDRLAFNNIRKFGRVWLLEDPTQLLGDLGPEPLEDSFTAEDLYQRLHDCSRQMKYFLLDQHKIAGLGNIYTDEALHQAGLHPTRKSDSLSRGEAERLWSSIRSVLKTGIKNQGSSIDWMYRGGDYQRLLTVYNLEGKPCKTCQTAIQRMKIAQRSTYYCPNCQPAPE